MKSSPLTLVRYGDFDKINWKSLTETDIQEEDGGGENLLHYVARAGLWDKLPPKLKDKKYWRETSNGTTIYMQAAQSPNMDWVKQEELTEEAIIRKNKIGHSIISLAIAHNNFKKIPRESITEKILTIETISNCPLIHLIALGNEIKRVPKHLLNEDLLCLRDSEGTSIYHTLADQGQLKDLPRKLLTKKGLTLVDDYGATPLLTMVEHEPKLIPQELLTPKFMLNNQFGETPLHAWATGEHWMHIPENLITKESLEVEAPRSLLECIISQYEHNRVWLSDNKEKSGKMHRLFSKALRLGKKDSLLEIKNTLEKNEHSILPKGLKKTSILINNELTKRKIVKALKEDKKEAYIEI